MASSYPALQILSNSDRLESSTADPYIPYFGNNIAARFYKEGKASTATSEKSLQNEAHGLALSDMKVKITSLGYTATFQLYDTVSAKEFYDQLPLEQDLTHFGDAQWMFHPPEKPSVTAREAYHGGKKGAPGYYAPWGNVAMFFGRFGFAAGLYELGHAISGCAYIHMMSGMIQIEKVSVP